MLGIQLFSAMRAMACIFTTSIPVGPERTWSTSPCINIGASVWTKDSGTNSVMPPVRCCKSRR